MAKKSIKIQPVGLLEKLEKRGIMPDEKDLPPLDFIKQTGVEGNLSRPSSAESSLMPATTPQVQVTVKRTKTTLTINADVYKKLLDYCWWNKLYVNQVVDEALDLYLKDKQIPSKDEIALSISKNKKAE